MPAATYLVVQFREKDKVKALGAKWDADSRRWYVPAGLDLTAFSAWLPDSASAAFASASRELTPTHNVASTPALTKGVPLSQVLLRVQSSIATTFQDAVWTTAEVVRIQARGHVYLELSERDPSGILMAQCRAMIWARTAQIIVPAFEAATGAELAPGVKLLVLARPSFSPEHGFGLQIEQIDPSFTLGDLAARKREILERIRREGLLHRQKRLPAPWDFNRLVVIAPAGAAGRGDFEADAMPLAQHGVCDFDYREARFQGPGAAAEVLETLGSAIEHYSNRPLDAVVIVRGGGAVNDLAWLNDYPLAKGICECPYPVLVGVGHERDHTVLDDVAHSAYDTPSKVIAGIQQVVRQRAREAQQHYDSVVMAARHLVERTRANTENWHTATRTGALATIGSTRAGSAARLSTVRMEAGSQLQKLRAAVDKTFVTLPATAMHVTQMARERSTAAKAAVEQQSLSAISYSRRSVSAGWASIAHQASRSIHRADESSAEALQSVSESSQATITRVSAAAESLMREIAGQGPQRTLARGFAMVRRDDGSVVSQVLTAPDRIEVVFADGQLVANVQRRVAGQRPEQGQQIGSEDV